MPQIWLTYAELGHEIGCSDVDAREHAIASGLDRRRCSDGLTRVKLPPSRIEPYLLSYVARLSGATPEEAATLDSLADTLVARLRAIAPAAADPARRRA